MTKLNSLKIKLLSIGLFSMFVFIGCESTADLSYFEHEIEDPNINASVKPLRLGYVTYSASDLFSDISTSNDLKIKVNDDPNVPITFVYSQNLDFNANTIDFVKIDDFSSTSTDKVNPFVDIIPTDTYTYNATGSGTDGTIGAILEDSSIPLEQDVGLTELISFASFKSGEFKVTFNSTYDFDIAVDVEIPSLIKIGDNPSKVFFKQTLNFSSTKKQDVLDIDLSEYFVDFTYTQDPSDNTKTVSNNCIENPASGTCTYNNVVVNIKTSFLLESGDIIRKSDDLTYTMDAKDISLLIVKGDFTGKPFNVNDQTINFDFFEEFKGLTYKAPELTFDVINGHGLPVGLDLTKISSVNTNTNNKVDLSITDPLAFPSNVLKIEGANLTSKNQSIPFRTTKALNSDNSNLADLIGSHQPNQFNFDIEATINPDGLPAGGNFVDLENTVEVKVGVEIPLEVKMEDLDFSPDALDFELDIEEYVENAKIILTTYNGLPFEADLELIFLDKDKNEITVNGNSFKKSVTVPSPTTTNGIVDVKITEVDDIVKVTKNGTDITTNYTNNIETNENISTITFTDDEIDAVKNVKFAKIVLVLNTPKDAASGDFVKILNENKIRVELAVGGKFKTEKI